MFIGVYLGLVEKVNDPERLGRVKVRVPTVYGVLGGAAGAVPVDDLPWALPFGLPAGNAPASGGADWLPALGDQVAVQFIDGEPEKPVWSWLMQPMESAKSFKLHQYEEKDGKVGNPKRGAWTRYGHTLEWNEGSLILTTSSGYRLFLLNGTDQDGRTTLSTQQGQFFELDDDQRNAMLNVLEDFYSVIGEEYNLAAGNSRIETINDARWIVGTDFKGSIGGRIDLSALGATALTLTGPVSLTTDASLSLKAASFMLLDYGSNLSLGQGASEPFVLGTQLTTFFNTMLLWLDTHTHTSSTPGSPTSPPVAPITPTIQAQMQMLLSKTIAGK